MKTLIQRVQRLGPTEHREIFKMISGPDKSRYMQNSNGIFVDLTTVAQEDMMKIQKFVDYCFHNNMRLDEYNNRLVECKIHQDYKRLPKLVNGEHEQEDADVDHKASDPCPPFSEETVDNDTNSYPQGQEFEDEASRNLRISKFGFLNTVTKRMTSSKFNQAKKRFAKKKLPKMDFGMEYMLKESYDEL